MKEVPGFLFNRLQLALYREALYCLENGVATAEDIDSVVKAGYGLRSANLGPLETSDFGGLDTFYRLAQNLFPDLSAAQTRLSNIFCDGCGSSGRLPSTEPR